MSVRILGRIDCLIDFSTILDYDLVRLDCVICYNDRANNNTCLSCDHIQSRLSYQHSNLKSVLGWLISSSLLLLLNFFSFTDHVIILRDAETVENYADQQGYCDEPYDHLLYSTLRALALIIHALVYTL